MHGSISMCMDMHVNTHTYARIVALQASLHGLCIIKWMIELVGAPLSFAFAELYNALKQEIEESGGAQTQSPGCANLDETSFDWTQLDHAITRHGRDQQCQDSRYVSMAICR